MSLEQVKLFYSQLSIDEAFRTQVQGAGSKEDCRQIVQNAGYDFTAQELEEYTAQILNPADDLTEVEEAELATVLGGFNALIKPGGKVQPLYGVIYPDPWPVPMYGVVEPPAELY